MAQDHQPGPGALLPAVIKPVPGPESVRLTDVLAQHESPGITARRARAGEARGLGSDPIVWDRAEGATIHELSVAGMTCNGCVNKLRGRLEALEGVAAVEVFLEPGSARVQGTITVDQFRQTIEDAGFTPV